MSDELTLPESYQGTTPGTQGLPAEQTRAALPVRIVNDESDGALASKFIILDPTAGEISVQLGFLARTMRIDNPTGQWWYCLTADVWIPPYWVGQVVPLYGVEAIRISPQNPPGGVLTSNPQPGEIGVLRIYNKDIPYSDGEGLIGAAGAPALAVTAAQGDPAALADAWPVQLTDGAFAVAVGQTGNNAFGQVRALDVLAFLMLWNGASSDSWRSIAAAGAGLGVARVGAAYAFANFTGPATTVVKATPGVIHAINVLAALVGTVSIQDNAAVIAVLPAGTAPGQYVFDVECATDITVVTSAADNIVATFL